MRKKILSTDPVCGSKRSPSEGKRIFLSQQNNIRAMFSNVALSFTDFEHVFFHYVGLEKITDSHSIENSYASLFYQQSSKIFKVHKYLLRGDN